MTDAVAPNYRDVVKEPMDLQTMEKRAKEGKDKNCLWVRECFEQIVYNALTFNADLGKIWLEAKRFNERGLKTIFEGQVRGNEERTKRQQTILLPSSITNNLPPVSSLLASLIAGPSS